jgi:uncharacterized protein
MDEIEKILNTYKSIAVVGISNRDGRPANYVPDYMRSAGYKIIPVNPTIEEWQGLKAWPDLKSVPEPVEIVNVFRRPADVPPVVDDAIAAGAKVIWMQSGIVNEAAAAKARAAGIQVVMDRCIMVEHRSL